MESATCTNCPTEPPLSPSSEDLGYDHSISFGVVMGVLGGMALVMLFVLIVVPLVRCRKGIRNGRSARKSSRSDDVESSFLASRRSSFLNQKMEAPSGPRALLPLIHRVSTFTWSDLRSKNLSADSMDQVATYSFHTDKATTSHLEPGQRTPPYDEYNMGDDDDGYTCSTASSPMRTPTPPGLPSKIGASNVVGRASPSGHLLSTDAGGGSPPMLPVSPVSPGAPAQPMSSSSRSRRHTMKPFMEPVPEHGGHTSPHSRQLPSPPASPDQDQPLQGTRRPTLTGTHSLSATLPFRPRSGSGPAPQLANAFDPSLLTALPSPDFDAHSSRSRSSTVSQEGGQQSEGVLRPAEAFRRMSTTDIRHRRPTYSPTEREPGPSQPSGSGRRASSAAVPPTLFSPVPLNTATPPPHAPYRNPTGSGRSEPSNLTWRSSLPPRPLPQHEPQPALVKRGDSRALRPLPPSAFASPPTSPRPSSSHSRTSSGRSVQTERSLPARVPPFNALPTMEFDRFTLSERERKASASSKKSRRNSVM